MELFALRGTTGHTYLSIDDAIDAALAEPRGPVVLTDVWDNPGGGTAGDATFVLRRFIERGVRDAAFGTIWDPLAVKLCMAAGVGAELPLRIGAKLAPRHGEPVDVDVVVKAVVPNAVQHFRDSVVPLGDSVTVAFDGLEVILNSNRAQSFEPDLFSNLGIDPLKKKMLVLKSANHFFGAFSKIATPHHLYRRWRSLSRRPAQGGVPEDQAADLAARPRPARDGRRLSSPVLGIPLLPCGRRG